MFANFIVRARGTDPAEASLAVHRFLDTTGDGDNAFTLLLLCSYDAGVRVVLCDEDDHPKRDREAAKLREELTSRDAMVELAKKIRFHDLFVMLAAAPASHERAVYEKIQEEYLAMATSPEMEERFLRATDGIMKDVLTFAMPDPTHYLESRAQLIEKLRSHSTERSFPFVETPGLSLHDARLFDLGGEGPEHYVIASVHV
jgi:hypothetical protein